MYAVLIVEVHRVTQISAVLIYIFLCPFLFCKYSSCEYQYCCTMLWVLWYKIWVTKCSAVFVSNQLCPYGIKIWHFVDDGGCLQNVWPLFTIGAAGLRRQFDNSKCPTPLTNEDLEIMYECQSRKCCQGTWHFDIHLLRKQGFESHVGVSI